MGLNLLIFIFQIVLIYPVVRIIMATKAIIACQEVIKECDEQLKWIAESRKEEEGRHNG